MQRELAKAKRRCGRRCWCLCQYHLYPPEFSCSCRPVPGHWHTSKAWISASLHWGSPHLQDRLSGCAAGMTQKYQEADTLGTKLKQWGWWSVALPPVLWWADSPVWSTAFQRSPQNWAPVAHSRNLLTNTPFWLSLFPFSQPPLPHLCSLGLSPKYTAHNQDLVSMSGFETVQPRWRGSLEKFHTVAGVEVALGSNQNWELRPP